LVTEGQYPPALLVFFASIAVPVLKLISLSIMLITIKTGCAGCEQRAFFEGAPLATSD
jgi:uncharacterized paraquat-inducible protein A